MKIYSNSLTGEDVHAAVPEGTRVDQFEPMQNTRVRSKGWKVHIVHPGSKRPANTGRYGGATDSTTGYNGSASWDEWGHFLSALYEKDPHGRFGPYEGREDFHAKTRGEYKRDPKPARSRASR